MKPGEFARIQGDPPRAVLPDGHVLLGDLKSVGPPFSTALRDPSTGERTVADSPGPADIARCERPCQCCSIPIA